MDYQKTGGYGIPMTGNIVKGYQNYYKSSSHVIVPYVQDNYQFQQIEENQSVGFQEQEIKELKVFDDNTLDFESKKLSMLDINKLDLQESNITEEGIWTISQSKNCINILELNLSRNLYNITDVCMRHLAQSQQLMKLETLILDDSAVTDYGIMSLTYPFTKPIDLDTMYALQRLRKTKKPFETAKGFTATTNFYNTAAQTQLSDSMTMYSESSRFHQQITHLCKLSLKGLNITDKGFQCLAYSQNVRLRYLDASFTKITDKGVIEYLTSSNCAILDYLDLSHQPITDESIKALSTSEYCKSLKVLKLDSCLLTNNSLLHLCNSENSVSIQELNLATYVKSYLTGEGVKIMSEAKYLSNLKILIIDGQPFPETQLMQFVQSPIMKNLEKLSVARNEDITDHFCSSVYDFYQKEQYKELKYLNLIKTCISERGVLLLQDCFKLVHSIDNLTEMKKIKSLTRAGIRCFICEKCLSQQDTERDHYRDKKPPINPSNCFICRTRAITTIEYPAKACYGCGKGFQEKTCFQCQKQIGKHQLFRCHLCSIGNNKFKCFNCEKLIEEKK